jgi:5-aminolevulinate synthase
MHEAVTSVAKGQQMRHVSSQSDATLTASQATLVNHATQSDVFDYEGMYREELDKKHKDKSYRYFNNINRLAQSFPRAHTANVEEEVTVWCSNDYLGMGRHPKVAEAMK